MNSVEKWDTWKGIFIRSILSGKFQLFVVELRTRKKAWQFLAPCMWQHTYSNKKVCWLHLKGFSSPWWIVHTLDTHHTYFRLNGLCQHRLRSPHVKTLRGKTSQSISSTVAINSNAGRAGNSLITHGSREKCGNSQRSQLSWISINHDDYYS